MKEKPTTIEIELVESERRAWDALSRYKFYLFGYWLWRWRYTFREVPRA